MKTAMTAVLVLSMWGASAFAAGKQDTTKPTTDTKSSTKVKKHKKAVKSTSTPAVPAAPAASK
jgi:hypothetical protein